MEYPIQGKKNSVVESLCEVINYLDEALDIDIQISKLKDDIVKLRVKYAEKRRKACKVFGASKRNYPAKLFSKFKDVVGDVQKRLEEVSRVEAVKYRQLIPTKVFDEPRRKDLRLNTGRGDGVHRTTKERKVANKSFRSFHPYGCSNGGNGMSRRRNVEWSRNDPGYIKIYSRDVVETHRVYMPGYFPNPLSNYLSRVLPCSTLD